MENLSEILRLRGPEVARILETYEGSSEYGLALMCTRSLAALQNEIDLTERVDLSSTHFGRTHLKMFADILSAPLYLSFQLTPESNEQMPDQLYWLALLLYMFHLEMGLQHNLFSKVSSETIAFFVSHIKEFPVEFQARYEFMRADLFSARSKQQDLRVQNEINELGAKYLNELRAPAATISGWEAKLNGWNTRAEKLEARIKQSTEELNFITLSKAFSQLKKVKDIELKSQTKLLKLYGFALGVMPLIPIVWTLFHSFQPVVLSWGSVPYFTGAVVIELLLLYFFRISLHNYYSIKGQLLQIDLRYNICAFIEGYADFIKERKGDGENKFMEKFEALIFSGISADPQNIPSQFDGLDQLVKLAKEIKKS